jgi:hypothetical protein
LHLLCFCRNVDLFPLCQTYSLTTAPFGFAPPALVPIMIPDRGCVAYRK